MGTKTGISWTDATWNPIRGCSRVSEGCRNCYAESIAHRFSGPGLAFEGLVTKILSVSDGKITRKRGPWNGQIKFVEEHLLDPLRWKKPRRIFVNSMSDLFHENVTDEMLDRIHGIMWACEYMVKGDACWPGHTFQVLTKRPERLPVYYGTDRRTNWARYAVHYAGGKYSDQLYDHVALADHVHPRIWLGVSVEDQKTADQRIPLLIQTPAAIRFISAEPLLGAIDLNEIEGVDRLDWIITGGESGHGARPMHPDWPRMLRDWCVELGVPFFFKQHGEWISLADYDPFTYGFKVDQYKHEFAWRSGVKNDAELPISCYCVGTKNAGCLLDDVEHHEFPVVQR